VLPEHVRAREAAPAGPRCKGEPSQGSSSAIHRWRYRRQPHAPGDQSGFTDAALTTFVHFTMSSRIT
jgi:hypothetical protein